MTRLKLFAALLLATSFLLPATALSHPLKLSASLVEYDAKRKTLRMECKVFRDDFELSLSRTVLKGRDLSQLKREERPQIVESYFKQFYSIRFNGERVPLKYESIEFIRQHNVLVIRFKAMPLSIKKGDKLEIRNLIMFQDFGNAQTNRIAVRIPPFGIDDGHAGRIDNYTFSYPFGGLKP